MLFLTRDIRIIFHYFGKKIPPMLINHAQQPTLSPLKTIKDE